MYVGPYIFASEELQCLVIAKVTGCWVVML